MHLLNFFRTFQAFRFVGLQKTYYSRYLRWIVQARYQYCKIILTYFLYRYYYTYPQFQRDLPYTLCSFIANSISRRQYIIFNANGNIEELRGALGALGDGICQNCEKHCAIPHFYIPFDFQVPLLKLLLIIVHEVTHYFDANLLATHTQTSWIHNCRVKNQHDARFFKLLHYIAPWFDWVNQTFRCNIIDQPDVRS